MQKIIGKNIKNIFIRMPDWVGTFVLATPVLKVIRDNFPESRISVCVRSWSKELLNNCSYINEIINYDSKSASLSYHIGFIRELKKKYPGVPVIVHSAYDRIDGYDDVKQQIEHYLVKPTPLTELKAKVKETMSKYKKLKKTTIPMNIIVVDDEKEICDFLTKYFMDEGHSAKSALTAKEAIELVKKEYFNIAFLDIVMPEVSGMEVLIKIKEISPDTKTIMITGKLKDANFFKQLKQSGASECLEKPFNMKEIQKTLTFHGDAT